MCPKPSYRLSVSSSKATVAMKGKNVFFHGQSCCRNCCSFSFILRLSLWEEDKDDSQLLSYQWEGVACMLAEVQTVDRWAEQLQSCVFIQEAHLHVNSCS